MYNIGIIDDTDDLFVDYQKRLKREDIELHFAPEGDMKDIKNWILQHQLKCLLIDYQLSSKFDFNGTQLAFYIDDALQGFQYLILTSYPEDSIDEKLVAKNAIYDRNVMDSSEEEFVEFCNLLKQKTEVYDNTIKKYKEKYEKLMKKKKENSLILEEEEELMDVFRILKSYREVDEIPDEMMKSSLSEQIDSMLTKLDNMLGL